MTYVLLKISVPQEIWISVFLQQPEFSSTATNTTTERSEASILLHINDPYDTISLELYTIHLQEKIATTIMNDNSTDDPTPEQADHHQVWNALMAVLRTRGDEFATTPDEQIRRLQSILEDSNMTFQQVYTAPLSRSSSSSSSDENENPREWNLLALALMQSLRQQLRGQHNSTSLDVVRWMLDAPQNADPWCTSGWLKFSAWELVVWHNHVPALRLLLETHRQHEEHHQQQQGGVKDTRTHTQHQEALLAKSLRMALEMGHWKAAQILLPYDRCLSETGNILHCNYT